MALSQIARDVLELLPKETCVDIETDDGIEIALPKGACIRSSTLDSICSAYQAGSEKSVRCSIDFFNDIIRLKQGGIVIVQNTHFPSGLTGTTEGETAAIRLAERLGVIDHDDLIPKFTVDTTETHVCLNIMGLLNVCHDALVYYLKDQPSYTLEYDMAQSTVSVLLPRLNKRKR